MKADATTVHTTDESLMVVVVTVSIATYHTTYFNDRAHPSKAQPFLYLLFINHPSIASIVSKKDEAPRRPCSGPSHLLPLCATLTDPRLLQGGHGLLVAARQMSTV